MDISASQYNNASESGWTHYLDQSSLSESYFQRRGSGIGEEEKVEVDLSMVSDASSGPPLNDDECYCENRYPCLSSTSKGSQKKKKVKEYGRSQQQSSPLDDTASSTVFNYPKESQKKKANFSGNGAVKNALDFSECLSAARIKRKPKFQEHFNFFAGKQASGEPGGFDEEEEEEERT